MKSEQPQKWIWMSWQWNGVSWFMSNMELSFCKEISESDFSSRALWRGSSWWKVRLYPWLVKHGGTGSLFLPVARCSAWWTLSCHNSGAGAFLPSGLPQLVSVRVGRRLGAEPWGSLLQRGTVYHGGDGDARGPCWSWTGALWVQEQTGETKGHFDPFAMSRNAKGPVPLEVPPQSHTYVPGIAWDKWLQLQGLEVMNPSPTVDETMASLESVRLLPLPSVELLISCDFHGCMHWHTCVFNFNIHTKLLSTGEASHRCQFLWNFPFSYLHRFNTAHVSRSLVFCPCEANWWSHELLAKIRTQTSK